MSLFFLKISKYYTCNNLKVFFFYCSRCRTRKPDNLHGGSRLIWLTQTAKRNLLRGQTEERCLKSIYPYFPRRHISIRHNRLCQRQIRRGLLLLMFNAPHAHTDTRWWCASRQPGISPFHWHSHVMFSRRCTFSGIITRRRCRYSQCRRVACMFVSYWQIAKQITVSSGPGWLAGPLPFIDQALPFALPPLKVSPVAKKCSAFHRVIVTFSKWLN